MPAIYSPMYVERQFDGSYKPPPYPMRFDLVAHEIKAGLGCILPDGKKNPAGTSITWTPVGQPFGNFAVCGLDVADPNWFGKFQAANAAEEVVADSMNIAPAVQALKPRCQAIVVKLRAYLDGLNVPKKPTDIERSVNGLLTIDLSGHHPRFEDIRSAYIAALSTVPTPPASARHWWMYRFLLDEMIDEEQHKVDTATLMAMRDCMTAHGARGQCKSIHMIYQLGVLATYLSAN